MYIHVCIGSIKIGDFGLASSLKRDKQTSKVGTPCYLSPEVLQNDTYGPAVDVWGAGCIVLEMMTFNFLWERRGMLSVQVLSQPVLYTYTHMHMHSCMYMYNNDVGQESAINL
jgi:serine/threonine protein kinase